MRRDAFEIVYDPRAVSVDGLKQAVIDTGFTPEEIDPIAEEAPVRVDLDLETIPEILKAVFRQARQLGRRVLIDIHGPG